MMRTHNEVKERIAAIEDEIESALLNTQHAQQFPPGSKDDLLDSLEEQLVELREERAALRWVLNEPSTEGKHG